MKAGDVLVEVLRAGRTECVHSGHAVICDESGGVLESWGDPEQQIYPRSSCKMIQALPLVESGAADNYGFSPAELAIACASHRGAEIHSKTVKDILARIGLSDGDLRCGPQMPRDEHAMQDVIRSGGEICRYHNNCSGKHSGFLALSRFLGEGPEYTDPDHPVQKSVRETFEATTGEESPGFGIDGCSAPNFVTTLHGLARAMASFASASDQNLRGRAQIRLIEAMTRHPEMVSGEDGTCTALMRATGGRAAVKTGAEGVYVAILPELRRGIAVKISDGAGRAAECVIAALLIRSGVLDADHPTARSTATPVLKNWDGLDVGSLRPAETLMPR